MVIIQRQRRQEIVVDLQNKELKISKEIETARLHSFYYSKNMAIELERVKEEAEASKTELEAAGAKVNIV